MILLRGFNKNKLFINLLKLSQILPQQNNFVFQHFWWWILLPATCNKIKSFWFSGILQATKSQTSKTVWHLAFASPHFETCFLHISYSSSGFEDKNCFELKILSSEFKQKEKGESGSMKIKLEDTEKFHLKLLAWKLKQLKLETKTGRVKLNRN